MPQKGGGNPQKDFPLKAKGGGKPQKDFPRKAWRKAPERGRASFKILSFITNPIFQKVHQSGWTWKCASEGIETPDGLTHKVRSGRGGGKEF